MKDVLVVFFFEMYPFTIIKNPTLYGKLIYWIKNFNTNSNQPLLSELDFRSIKDHLNDKLIHKVYILHSLNDIVEIYQDSSSKILIEFDTKQKVVIFGNIYKLSKKPRNLDRNK